MPTTDDDLLTLYALRANLLSMPAVAETVETELEATAVGYARADGGSFVADGFMVGMEVAPVGFEDASPGLIGAVAPTLLTIVGGREPEPSAPLRWLYVAVPELRAWEGTVFPPKVNGSPVDLVNRWYVEEDFPTGPERVETVGAHAQVEHTPLYVLKLYSPPGYGVDAPYTLAGAVKAHFPPHAALLRSDGNVVRVRGDVAPYRGQLTTRDGYALVTVTIPLRVRTVNSI